MKTFRHSSNERNRSNVIRLRMKHGAAGYGIYMMLLERLASEPHLRSELDYDMLAYDFQADAALIRHVVEDFDLFDIDLDADTFSHPELNRQMSPKTARAQQEQILDEFIASHAADSLWLENQSRPFDTSPDRLRQILQTSFRAHVLSLNLRTPSTTRLLNLLTQHLHSLRE